MGNPEPVQQHHLNSNNPNMQHPPHNPPGPGGAGGAGVAGMPPPSHWSRPNRPVSAGDMGSFQGAIPGNPGGGVSAGQQGGMVGGGAGGAGVAGGQGARMGGLRGPEGGQGLASRPSGTTIYTIVAYENIFYAFMKMWWRKGLLWRHCTRPLFRLLFVRCFVYEREGEWAREGCQIYASCSVLWRDGCADPLLWCMCCT